MKKQRNRKEWEKGKMKKGKRKRKNNWINLMLSSIMSRILSYLVVVLWFTRAVNLAAMISWSRSSSWKPFENLPAAGRWLDCICLLVSLMLVLMLPSPFSSETSVRSFLIRLPSNALSSALSSILADGLLTQGFVWSWLSVLIVPRQRRRFNYVYKNLSPPVGQPEYPTILSESAGLLVSIALPVITHKRHSRPSTRANRQVAEAHTIWE